MKSQIDEESIAEKMRKKLLADYLGKGSAKPRRFLLFHCRYHEPGLKDRRMRRIYKKLLPIGWCRKGIYVIDDPEEVRKMIQTETKRKDSIDENIKMLEDHKAFLVKRQKARESGQMNLFRGN